MGIREQVERALEIQTREIARWLLDRAEDFERPREALICTRKLIERPERWTKQAWARDAQGRIVLPSSPRACRWSISGALSRVTRARLSQAEEVAYAALRHAMPPGYCDVMGYENAPGTSHNDILALVDRAIAVLDAEAARRNH
jgi:hypothetical protein